MSEKPTYEKLAHRVRELEKTDFRHKQAVEALKKSEQRYRSAQQIGKVGNWE